MAYPNSVNYDDIPQALKNDVISTTIIINPVNSKATFSPGDIILFDYTTSGRGFVDPKSIYLSYKAVATNGNTLAGKILGTPVYSPFLRIDTIINSQTIESVNQWNQICQIYCNTNMSVADKQGVQSQYGFLSTAEGDITYCDYRQLTANTTTGNNTYFVSAPLICNVLTGMEKLIPAFLMPQIRQQLKIDALTNFVSNSDAGNVTDFAISNIQITYQLIDFGSELQNSILSRSKFLIKSNGWSNSATSIAAAVVGSQSIVFNQRFASIKSAIIVASNGTNATQKSFDFMDITNGGTYQISIGGVTFPQLALNAGINRSAIIQELRK